MSKGRASDFLKSKLVYFITFHHFPSICKLKRYNLRMEQITVAIGTFVIASFLFLWSSIPSSAELRKIDLDFENQTLSARIENVTLRAVIRHIEGENDIWFRVWLKGSEFLLNETISVQFQSLPLKEGMERIFSVVNHSLVFDHNGELSGVFLLGKPGKVRSRARRRIISPRKGTPRYRRR